ncbi:17.5 kDa heat shock family protein [Tripterygium wilfordii]|uniref:17.5 kDa heat shock family protein n=1 Tax=Tripterygium wilfordii TaxID=458696 RepID=A0A7J7DSV6_TRIWF|nr:18.5 kDa class I heat shock protein-like [Tripterygium wilfordii]KAF5749369.1 17.5 kDa heat shock family protein [Tripterygium wilfordii]
MSIVPINSDQRDLTIFSPFSSLDLWDPFPDFPFSSLLSDHFPELSRGIFSSTQTQVGWKETPRSHVFRAYLPGEDALVYIDDDRMLQISTESGKFSGKFKLPVNAKTDQVEARMVNGVLIVTVAKEGAASERPNVRAIEISGE